MNPNTGEVVNIFENGTMPRGFVPVSARVADAVEIGMEALNRADRRRRERKARKRGRGYTR